jgi:WD repeat-containing protein 6
MKHYEVKLNGEIQSLASPLMHADILLPKSMHVTACVYLHAYSLLVLASRAGCLVAYDLSAQASPVIVFRRVHGKEAITSLMITNDASESCTIHSVARDGCYCKCTLSRNSSTNTSHLELALLGWTIERTHQSKITKGWLSKIMLVESDILIAGFHGADFFVYYETKKLELINVPCGGGHRIWDFRAFDPLLKNSHFGYIKRDILHLVQPASRNLIANPYLQKSYHGLETSCVAVAKFSEWDGKLIISGGEDGTLSFHSYTSNSFESTASDPLVPLESIRKHFASIKCLHISKATDGTTLLFSGGSMQVIKCWKLSMKMDKVICIDWATCKPVTDLVETRIMSVSALLKDGKHMVAAGCSDGFVRVFPTLT